VDRASGARAGLEMRVHEVKDAISDVPTEGPPRRCSTEGGVSLMMKCVRGVRRIEYPIEIHTLS
jgi:hypothetical protein